MKAVTKRDIANSSDYALPAPSTTLETDAILMAMTEKPEPPLSENVNLFQSLRVLQEGETDDESFYTNSQHLEMISNQTCLKTTTFSAMTATFSVMFCVLSASLMVTCSRLRQRIKQTTLYDHYIMQKGQIDWQIENKKKNIENSYFTPYRERAFVLCKYYFYVSFCLD